jgi:hypothetical protein
VPKLAAELPRGENRPEQLDDDDEPEITENREGSGTHILGSSAKTKMKHGARGGTCEISQGETSPVEREEPIPAASRGSLITVRF